ncbi:LOW QUALITY PROTEIN: uncharacterized protein LOC125005405 [Xyrichtys novacula]|uniref:LOW QUALITY PROTEIN: uncharacterized protein LOC125005405 n=1 Tax=Xyrichtys novacula TaxID=13765 RepID=A0AAV1GLH2_XYRNO|nr:LOW QUALITY PROTEIN: uncharacterized protein LOC125005405 [Xyrichtys novacula]
MSNLLLALSASLQEATRHAGEPSAVFQWNLESFLALRLWRCLSAQSKSDRQDNSFQIFLLPAGLGVLPLLPSIALICKPIPLATSDLSPHIHSLLSSRRRTFRAQGVTRCLSYPPEPLEAGGPGAEAQGPVVGCFSQQQHNYWAASTRDPWALSTLTHGYKLQFRHRPPTCDWVKMTIICNPTKAQALSQDLSILLDKGAIESTLFLGMSLNAVTMMACPSSQRVDDILRFFLLFRKGRWLHLPLPPLWFP